MFLEWRTSSSSPRSKLNARCGPDMLCLCNYLRMREVCIVCDRNGRLEERPGGERKRKVDWRRKRRNSVPKNLKQFEMERAKGGPSEIPSGYEILDDDEGEHIR